MRDVVIVDCESTGLRPFDIAVEVAWYNYTTGASGMFVPPHDQEWVKRTGEPKALEMNEYMNRIYGYPMDDGTAGRAFRKMVEGAVLLGSNVRQDAAWLSDMFVGAYNIVDDSEPWFHRLDDLGSMYLWPMRRPLNDPPGLADICGFLGIAPETVHTAMSGVMTTVEAVRRYELMRSEW